MQRSVKEEKYFPSADYYNQLSVIEAISYDTKKAVEYLQRFYNKKLTIVINNYFIMSDKEVLEYLNDFYYEIIPDLRKYDSNIEFHFFVEYLLIKKIRTQIKSSESFKGELRIKKAQIFNDDNLKSDSITTKFLFKLLSNNLIIYIAKKYYYFENENLLIKECGKKKVNKYDKLLCCIFGSKADIKINNWINNNQKSIINTLNRNENKSVRISKVNPKMRGYWDYTVFRSILCVLFLIIFLVFIQFYI